MGGKVRRKNDVEYGKVFPREKYPVIYPIKTAPLPGWEGAGGLGDISLMLVRWLSDDEINALMLPAMVNSYDEVGLLQEQKPDLFALILLDILVLIDTEYLAVIDKAHEKATITTADHPPGKAVREARAERSGAIRPTKPPPGG